jgi:hypothetical protein
MVMTPERGAPGTLGLRLFDRKAYGVTRGDMAIICGSFEISKIPGKQGEIVITYVISERAI